MISQSQVQHPRAGRPPKRVDAPIEKCTDSGSRQQDRSPPAFGRVPLGEREMSFGFGFVVGYCVHAAAGRLRAHVMMRASTTSLDQKRYPRPRHTIKSTNPSINTTGRSMRRLLTGRAATGGGLAPVAGGSSRPTGAAGAGAAGSLVPRRPLASTATPKLTEWMSFEKQAPSGGAGNKQQGAVAKAKAAEADTRRTGAIALKVCVLCVMYDMSCLRR